MLPLPLAFMPDGASVLVNAAGALQRVRVADGSIASTAMLGNAGPVAVSADGGVVAFAGTGGDLLRVWKTDDGVVSPVCATTAPVRRQPERVALGGRPAARDRARRQRPRRAPRRRRGGEGVPGQPGHRLHAGRAVAARERTWRSRRPWNANGGAVVARISDDATVASFMPDTSGWLDFLFTPGEDKVYSLGKRSADYSIDTVRFAAPDDVTNRIVPAYTTLLGFAGGCPVLYSGARGAWRSCGGCEDTPIAAGPPDGDRLRAATTRCCRRRQNPRRRGRVQRARGHASGACRPTRRALLTIGQRAEEATWMPQEFPVAIAAAGERMLTGRAAGTAAATDGPRFEVYVRDSGRGEVHRQAAAGSHGGRRHGRHDRLRRAALVRASTAHAGGRRSGAVLIQTSIGTSSQATSPWTKR